MNWFYNRGLGPSTLAEFPKTPSAIYAPALTLYFAPTQPAGYFSYARDPKVLAFIDAENIAGYGRTKADNLATCDKARAAGFAVDFHEFA